MSEDLKGEKGNGRIFCHRSGRLCEGPGRVSADGKKKEVGVKTGGWRKGSNYYKAEEWREKGGKGGQAVQRGEGRQLGGVKGRKLLLESQIRSRLL